MINCSRKICEFEGVFIEEFMMCLCDVCIPFCGEYAVRIESGAANHYSIYSQSMCVLSRLSPLSLHTESKFLL